MKFLLLLPLLGLAFIASSCRTVPPLDPMTGKLNCKCLPEHFHAPGCDLYVVTGTK
ncbi:MAG: hypothetical protein V4819_10140 [Verrucomicrobiota bacterium]